MKKILNTIMVAVAILATSSGFAQESKDTRENLKFGVKAGLNVANVYDEQNADFVADNKLGFVGGAFVAIPLGKYLGIQPEVLYSQKGFKTSRNTIVGNYDYSVTSTYLDIPLQVQLKPIKYLTILAGPQYSYLLKTKSSFNGNATTLEEESLNSDNYKKNIFGFVVGADVNFDNLILSGRAGWDISKTNSDGDSSTPRYKNQVLQFTLGYTF